MVTQWWVEGAGEEGVRGRSGGRVLDGGEGDGGDGGGGGLVRPAGLLAHWQARRGTGK